MRIFRVDDILCGHCGAKISKALADNRNIKFHSINLKSKKVTVDSDLDDSEIIGIIETVGYTAEKE